MRAKKLSDLKYSWFSLQVPLNMFQRTVLLKSEGCFVW